MSRRRPQRLAPASHTLAIQTCLVILLSMVPLLASLRPNGIEHSITDHSAPAALSPSVRKTSDETGSLPELVNTSGSHGNSNGTGSLSEHVNTSGSRGNSNGTGSLSEHVNTSGSHGNSHENGSLPKRVNTSGSHGNSNGTGSLSEHVNTSGSHGNSRENGSLPERVNTSGSHGNNLVTGSLSGHVNTSGSQGSSLVTGSPSEHANTSSSHDNSDETGSLPEHVNTSGSHGNSLETGSLPERVNTSGSHGNIHENGSPPEHVKTSINHGNIHENGSPAEHANTSGSQGNSHDNSSLPEHVNASGNNFNGTSRASVFSTGGVSGFNGTSRLSELSRGGAPGFNGTSRLSEFTTGGVPRFSNNVKWFSERVTAGPSSDARGNALSVHPTSWDPTECNSTERRDLHDPTLLTNSHDSCFPPGAPPPPRSFRCTFCLIAPEGFYIGVRAEDVVCKTLLNSVTIREINQSADLASGLPLRAWTLCGRENLTDDVVAETSSRVVEVRFTVTDSSVRNQFFVRLKGWKSGRRLEHVIVSESTGFVQTPGWTPQRQAVDLRDMRSGVDVVGPPGTLVMISFPHLELQDVNSNHFIRVARWPTTSSSVLWKTNGGTVAPRPAVYHTSRFTVVFTRPTLANYTYPGFRLLYTFHQPSEAPRPLPERDGRWNCSAATSPSFLAHLRCDLLPQCDLEQDETGCGYALCHPGGFVVNGTCYFLRRTPETPLSPNVARVACLEEGGRLASLSTPERWSRLMELLFHKTKYDVIVGIASSLGGLPALYFPPLLWEDGTVAYYVTLVLEGALPVCGSITHRKRRAWTRGYSREDEAIVLSSCRQRDPLRPITFYLCQVDQPVNMSRDPPITVPRAGASTLLGSSSKLQKENEDNNNHTTTSTTNTTTETTTPTTTTTPKITPTTTNLSLVECPDGHLTHCFLVCDRPASCYAPLDADVRFSSDRESWDVPLATSCPVPSMTSFPVPSTMTSLPPSFLCGQSAQRVPYSLVCDHRPDCQDASDEAFCVFPPCPGTDWVRCGNSKQCYSLSDQCDFVEDCVNGADELVCLTRKTIRTNELVRAVPPPAIVNLEPPPDANAHFGGGVKWWMKRVRPLNTSSLGGASCPPTHFRCPGGGGSQYCLPVYVLCNGVSDCGGHHDEMGCDRLLCPGFYRCRGSRVCVHPVHLCDGVNHCPRHDDEQFCRLQCPHGCTCQGLTVTCPARFRSDDPGFKATRYLDARDSGAVSVRALAGFTMLVYLSLARCNLSSLAPVSLPNLHVLDLSDNRLAEIGAPSIAGLSNLRVLFLANNLLTSLFSRGNLSFTTLRFLDLSGVEIPLFRGQVISQFPNLRGLNLSGCDVLGVEDSGFSSVTSLETLDLTGCPMRSVTPGLFRGLDRLRSLRADNYKLCCPTLLPPGVEPWRCDAPVNEISSCSSLLRSGVYRAFLYVFMALALLGNATSLLVRGCLNKERKASGFVVFVTHLGVADLLMGVYLALIGAADRRFRDSYLWEDSAWRDSAACRGSGALALAACEVSALIIVLITLDRFLVLTLPFSNVRFHRTSAHVTCGLVWLVGAMLAGVPLLPAWSHWRLYGQTGVCVPLPVTRPGHASPGHASPGHASPGHAYAQHVLIGLNLALFVIIAAGQVAIFFSIRSQTLSTDSSGGGASSREMSVARRLFSVAASDFLCWFPVGVLGLMAKGGTTIPGEVRLGLVIFVLPLNSVLNPFLYTLNVLVERRKAHRERQLTGWLKHQVHLIADKEGGDV